MQSLNFDECRGRRKSLKSRLTRIQNQVARAEPDLARLREFEKRLKDLEACWIDLEQVQERIIQLVDDDSESGEPEMEEAEEHLQPCEQQYLQVSAQLMGLIEQTSALSRPALPVEPPPPTQTELLMAQMIAQNAELLKALTLRTCPAMSAEGEVAAALVGDAPRGAIQGVRLPPLAQIKFSGEQANWNRFSALYKSVIHENRALDNAQKMHYLQTAVAGGEAEARIRHFGVAGELYDEAWTRLTDRNGKIKNAVMSHIRAFRDQAAVKKEDIPGSLQRIYDTSDGIVRSIRALGAGAEALDFWQMSIVMEKLDEETVQAWSLATAEREMPTFADLLKFIENRSIALALSTAQKRQIATTPGKGSSAKAGTTLEAHVATAEAKCPSCAGDHQLYRCDAFKAMSVTDRKTLAFEKRLCFTCLSENHRFRQCKSKGKCSHCGSSHHSLLHSASAPSITDLPNDSTTSPSARGANYTATSPDALVATEDTIHTMLSHQKSLALRALMPTAIAETEDAHGRRVQVRVLFDSASMVSFITEACAQALGTDRKHARLPICGLSHVQAGVTRGRVTIRLRSLHDEGEQISVELLVLSRITGRLPHTSLDEAQFDRFRPLELADPNFKDGQVRFGDDEPIAQNTRFGWIVSGKVEMDPQIDSQCGIYTCVSNLDLDRLLRQFFELEALKMVKPITPQEELVEGHFEQTHRRDDEGRFIVRLPFNEKKQLLGRNVGAAIRALLALERRFLKDPELRTMYVAFMREFEALGHMEEVPVSEIERQECTYLPHLAVRKESSTTTRLRTVFHASFRSESGVSLNEALHVGPVLQRPLREIVRNFRRHRVALIGDVEKMYRMVIVHPEDSEYQRIVWRDEPELPIRHLRITRVTYGTGPASYLATKVLQKAADGCFERFPLAAAAIRDKFYVDDFMDGCDSVEEAVRLRSQVSDALQAVGFHLRKWASNCDAVLDSIPAEDRAIEHIRIGDKEQTIGALGMQWQPQGDYFSFKIQRMNEESCTRRSMASDSARIYDPLGLLAPVTIAAKILIQLTWLDKELDWDTPLPPLLAARWRLIRQELHMIERLRIPRWLMTVCRVQVHGFSDASTQAYCAAVYVRVTDEDGVVHTQLLEARTRVAPTKTITLARLELCASLLLADLMKEIEESMVGLEVETFAWTDAADVLYWLSSHPSKWSTFVANRTSRILQTLPAEKWRHIDGKENPADCATRGMLPSEMVEARLWWDGPEWLKLDAEAWPITKVTAARDEAAKETRRSYAVLHTQPVTIAESEEKEMFEPQGLQFRYSTLGRVLRISAWCRRFIVKLRQAVLDSQTGRRNGVENERWSYLENGKWAKFVNGKWDDAENGTDPFSKIKVLAANDIQTEVRFYVRLSQRRTFPDELARLVAQKFIKKKSPLSPLCPIIDPDGLIRVSGRLENADISFDAKHPVVLDAKDRFTQLLVHQMHGNLLHAGPALMNSTLRRNYWIIGARTLLRKTYRDCMVYFRMRARTGRQQMGSLPIVRVTPAPAFDRTGVDYAGPFLLRNMVGRATRARGQEPYKAYIVIFVCMVTRAVHLELASDLSTDTFLAAFKRFISRRGKPRLMFSDQGTNFVGAKNKLDDLEQFLQTREFRERIAYYTGEGQIEWSLNPPLSPNFGGLWEAAVKSVKGHLRAVLLDRKLTFEEFYTVLTLIEACLNSRPICGKACDPEQVNPLTPGYLLIGRPLVALPERYDRKSPENRLDRWVLMQKVADDFWQRWHKEVLVEMQRREKWVRSHEDVRPGEIVAVQEDDIPPTKWPLARVVETHPGPDGLVRVVTLTDGKRIFQRNVRRLLFPLPGNCAAIWPAEC